MQTIENQLKEYLDEVMENEDLLFGEEITEQQSFIIEYVFNTLGEDASNEDIDNAIKQLYLDHLLESLVNKGYLTVTFDDSGKILYEAV